MCKLSPELRAELYAKTVDFCETFQVDKISSAHNVNE
jgi:hypothetical protein